MATVYMLLCADGTIYTGYTFDMERRLAAHNGGRGAKYTKSRLPVSLLWCRDMPVPSLARAAEVYIKQLTRRQKLSLAAGEGDLLTLCPKLAAKMQDYEHGGKEEAQNQA